MANPNRRPVTEADDALVRELHAQGLGRNAIARKLHRSGRTVSHIAARLGLDFDREVTRVATEAKVLDAKARRAQLALDLLDDAQKLRTRAWSPYRMAVGFDLVTVELPPGVEVRSFYNAIGIAVDKSIAIEKHDRADESMSGVDAWLRAMTGRTE